MLHGRDVLYVVEERAPGRPPLVTDVGVRLPAHLTASGRAILAELPAAQVRALYPNPDAFVDRHGTGPRTLSRLRTLLADTRQRGFAIEEGEVTPGLSSVAVRGPRPQRPPGRGDRADLRRRRRPGSPRPSGVRRPPSAGGSAGWTVGDPGVVGVVGRVQTG